MTHNIKQRVRDGKVEYFDENNGWLDKQEYFDLIPGSDIETEEDDDLTRSEERRVGKVCVSPCTT